MSGYCVGVYTIHHLLQVNHFNTSTPAVSGGDCNWKRDQFPQMAHFNVRTV
ncbi:UNVERIFIED_CONTAM: hypothetical protein FKN15_026101 [Acipenser sinensis]